MEDKQNVGQLHGWNDFDNVKPPYGRVVVFRVKTQLYASNPFYRSSPYEIGALMPGSFLNQSNDYIVDCVLEEDTEAGETILQWCYLPEEVGKIHAIVMREAEDDYDYEHRYFALPRKVRCRMRFDNPDEA